jgi:hypothetical protein
MSFSFRQGLLAAALVAFSATASADLVFDNISAPLNGDAGTLSATGSTPNTFMGAGMLLPGTTQITGFDLFPYNNTGTDFTDLKLNIYVWGGVNTGTVNTANPAFSNLLGSYSFTSSGNFGTGYLFLPGPGRPRHDAVAEPVHAAEHQRQHCGHHGQRRAPPMAVRPSRR